MLLKPVPHRIREIHDLSAKVNLGQAVVAFEVLDDMPVVCGVADLRDTEKLDQFLFGHDGGTRDESVMPGLQDGCSTKTLFWYVHGSPLAFFPGIDQNQGRFQ